MDIQQRISRSPLHHIMTPLACQYVPFKTSTGFLEPFSASSVASLIAESVSGREYELTVSLSLTVFN